MKELVEDYGLGAVQNSSCVISVLGGLGAPRIAVSSWDTFFFGQSFAPDSIGCLFRSLGMKLRR